MYNTTAQINIFGTHSIIQVLFTIYNALSYTDCSQNPGARFLQNISTRAHIKMRILDANYRN